MVDSPVSIHTLVNTLLDEVVNASGLPKTPAWRNLFRLFFGRTAERMARICLTGDGIIATDGAPASAAWMASHWVSSTAARGVDTIPATGPLLVATNHCGVYDFLILTSLLNRRDIKIISSDVAFLKQLPNISHHLIYLSDESSDRMAAARAGIRHLQDGGSLLLFGTGSIDPDPAVYPGAAAAIDAWSPSIDLFLHQTPATLLVIGIASGFITQRWAHSPLTRLRRVDWQQRRVVEFAQVLQQLFRPGSLYLTPQVSFAPPVDMTTLQTESGSQRVLPAVITRAKTLLDDHIYWISQSNS